MLKHLPRILLFALALGLCGQAAAQKARSGAAAQPGAVAARSDVPQLDFDHNTTGFPLEGAHVRERCESCHTKGTFRGTPRECAGCHIPGGLAGGKPPRHVPSAASCDACHRTVTWTPATFRHLPTQGVAQGGCADCHSGAYAAQNARAKSPAHPPTAAACDACHRSSAWLPARYTHAAADAGRCAGCHDGTRATGRPATHIPGTAACDACHSTGGAWAPIGVSVERLHSAMAGPAARGNCAACHGGGFVSQNAQVKPAKHVATTQQCDTCHKSLSSWATVSFDHAVAAPPVAGRCASCHGTSALGKPASHIPTGAQCDSCHTSFAAFKPAQMKHVGLAGQCASCHNGAFNFANALAKPATHIPTNSQCDACHVSGFVAWAPSTMNHAGSAGKCSTCHSGGFAAQTKPAVHVPTTAQCDTCHSSTSTWSAATFNHDTATPPVAARCTTCHNGVIVLGKPVVHVPTAQQCDSCHAGYTAFKPARMSHAGTVGACASCHGGAYVAQNAVGKPSTHVGTAAQCDTCHKSTTTWATVSFNHSAATPPAAGRCSSCHNGSAASGKPVTHIPGSAQCDVCHKNYVAFAPATMSHTGTTGPLAAGNCSTCHGGAYTRINAQAKPATHVATTAQCDTCHKSATTWSGAIYTHDATAVGKCSTCHNGATALGKPASHIPGTAQCDTCHKNYVAFAPATMNHAGSTGPLAAGNCSTCHGGAYTRINAQAKPATHVATTAQCDTCHKSVTTWTGATYAHAATAVGKCSTCHNGSTASGKPAAHIPGTAQCDTCHKNYVAFAPATMNHAGSTGPLAAGNCSTCHSGAYAGANAQAKPATHVATTAQCDTCHKSVTTWTGATYAHAATAVGTCSTCHNGSTASGKPAAHIPGTAQCDVCHKNYVAFAPATMNHAGSTGPLAAGNCSTCHSGAYAGANAQAKPATHVATTAQCDTCHKSVTTWTGATYAHAVTAVGKCSTCHNGSTAQGKPATHIPSTAQCDVCHKNYVAFQPAQMSHPGTTGPVAVGNCTTCHNGAYAASNALGKGGTHIPTTSQCSTCHAGYVAFAPATMNHGGTSGPLAAGNCATCHNGAYLAANAQAKSATHVATTAQCDTCHTSTSNWSAAPFNHGTALPPVAGRCATCHNGVSATGKTATHLPTSQSCDACHNTVAWSPTSFTHQGVVAGACATCHNGSAASGKPGGHIPSTQSCDACHRTGLAWLPLITPYAHTGVAPGACTTCHSSGYANISVKPASHLPTTAACDACHHNFSSWQPASAYNHSGIASGTCQTCHGGTYAGVTTKPAGNAHIPTLTPAGAVGNECSRCHSSTTSFATERMNHGTMQTSCITCHDSTSPYPGSMDKIRRSSHENAGTRDCSSSGCHRPLGTRGTLYTRWD